MRWKNIAGYDNYQVSDCGQVRNTTWRKSGIRVLKQRTSQYGYPYVRLYNDKGKPKYMLVHRLVASSFIDNPGGKPTVNHIDEVKHHNHVSNLEWATVGENNNHGTGNERRAKSRMKPVRQMDMDGNTLKIWESATSAGRSGYQSKCVTACCRGVVKTHSGYRWEFV